MKVSFILPCYNVERYVSDCLDSIYAQDIPEDEYEVICVNDCSTDNTGDILNDYKSVHKNLTVINHSVNQTVGGARNSGLKAAQGHFLWFVDPDDFIPDNCLKELVDVAERRDVDILLFNYRVVNSEKVLKRECMNFPDSDVMSGQEYILKYTPNKISAITIVWRCLYKTSFLQNNGCKFPIMRKGQDDSFQWRAMLWAERVSSTDKAYYVYRENPDSVSNKMYIADVVFSDRMLNAHQINMLLHDDSLQIRKEIADDLIRTLRWAVNSTIELVAKMSASEQCKYYQKTAENREIVKSLMPYMSHKPRFMYSLSGGQLIWRAKLKTLSWLNFFKKIRKRLLKWRLTPVRVFCFHQVSDAFDPDAMWEGDWMQTEDFKRKILELNAHGRFISLPEAYHHICHDWFRVKKYVVLTADDGNKTLLNILPWIAEQQIPITLFLNPSYMNGFHNPQRGKEQYLENDDVQKIVKEYAPFVSIASHGWNHERCSEMKEDDFRKNVKDAEFALAKYSVKLSFFAFPYGNCSKTNLEELKENGLIPVLMDGKQNYCDSSCIHRELL